MDWNALAAVAGAVAAAVAAWQLWRIRVDALDMRAAEIESVALITKVGRASDRSKQPCRQRCLGIQLEGAQPGASPYQ